MVVRYNMSKTHLIQAGFLADRVIRCRRKQVGQQQVIASPVPERTHGAPDKRFDF
jgi:hypothetical protein